MVELGRAARNTGFFLVTGHGVNQDAATRLYDAARSFFDLPNERRAEQPSQGSVIGGVSYAPIAPEALAATQGRKTPGDIKHSLNYGLRLSGADWPDTPAGLQNALAVYFIEMEKLAPKLRRMFCAAIGLPPDYFEPEFTRHLSAPRVIDYPEQISPPLPGQLRAGAHTDYGFMIILRSEASPGGLQVQNRAGDWLDAPSVIGALIINIGDAFMRWSNGHWVSTPHRVVNPPSEVSGARRQSIPFFLNPNRETVISCLPPFEGKGARYAPVTFGDYIREKTEQAFG